MSSWSAHSAKSRPMTTPFLLALALAAAPAGKPASLSSTIEIQNQKFTLDNGLTLIVHEDHKAPIVAVSNGFVSVRIHMLVLTWGTPLTPAENVREGPVIRTV